MFYTSISKFTVNLETRLRFRLRPDLSYQIRQNPAPARLEENKSATALIKTRPIATKLTSEDWCSQLAS